MGMLTLLTTGMEDIKKEINSIKIRLNNLEGKNTQAGTPNQTQRDNENKEKEKSSNLQNTDKDKDKSSSGNKDNNRYSKCRRCKKRRQQYRKKIRWSSRISYRIHK